jgi:hypothetical protein
VLHLTTDPARRLAAQLSGLYLIDWRMHFRDEGTGNDVGNSEEASF